MIKDKARLENSLERFIVAQDQCYGQVLEELMEEQKKTHWMWFIFPQAVGLGHSEHSKYYAIKDVEEAKAYLAHPTLGVRYEECMQVLAGCKSSAAHIFGEVDAMKLKSSLTLFLKAQPESPLLIKVFNKYFE
ncbi:DUF1810 domain-containing protein [Polynucleobacter corsicus]|uniref:DUF1810 domain-containing protein n=1 Tax=Polynucleobacter corsicus TaxID=2081042 RepID=UPI001BFE260F|nr:DUF1810 family protein [Polynucleobacter corsicus]QWE19484.1 DUF1810 family protein [Polynucleobacter corsicus]